MTATSCVLLILFSSVSLTAVDARAIPRATKEQGIGPSSSRVPAAPFLTSKQPSGLENVGVGVCLGKSSLAHLHNTCDPDVGEGGSTERERSFHQALFNSQLGVPQVSSVLVPSAWSSHQIPQGKKLSPQNSPHLRRQSQSPHCYLYFSHL